MNLRERINNSIAQPGIKLLSQIPISDNEYRELIAEARSYIQHMYTQTIVPANPVVAVTLVQIAIRAYSEGNYWDYFIDEIGMAVPSSKRYYLGQVFASTLKQYHLFELEREIGSKYAYVENIKAHAFVPNNYLSGYWDFLFAFYDRNILRQLPESIEEDFSEMAEFFASTLKDTGDSFSLRNLDNKPAKSYKLLKATRSLFAQGDPIILSNEIYHHLQIIDGFYYDDMLPAFDERFGESFNLWQKKNAEIHDASRNGIKRRSGAFYHRPYFQINRANGTAELIIPEQKIRNDDFSNKVVAVINENGKIRSFELSLYRAFGVIVSDQIRIPIDNIFGHIEIQVKSLVTKSFDIPERDYRLFDNESVELLKLKTGQNYILTKKGANVRGHKALYVNKNQCAWDEYAFSDVTDDTVIYINNSPISITGTFAEGPDFAHTSHEYKLYKNGSEYQTAYRHPTISFKIQKELYNGAFLWCNDDKFHIDDVAASVVTLPDASKSYGITIILDDLLEKKAGVYRVFVDEPSKTKREICQYVLLPDLRCRPEKPRFMFASEAGITITGSYDIQPINAIRIEEGGNDYLVDLANGEESGKFTINIDGNLFELVVPLQIFKHGFEKQWQFERPEYLWVDDLKNDFYIAMPGAIEAKVYLASRTIDIFAVGTNLGDGIFRFDISEIVDYIRTSTQAYNYISLKYTDNKERNLSLYRVLNRIYVDKVDVVFDHDMPRVDVKYEGKNDLVLRFCDEKTDEILVEKTVTNGMNDFPELPPDGLFTMYMFEAISDSFGFSTELKGIGYPKSRIGVINYDDLSNCKLNVQNVLWAGRNLTLSYSYAVFSLQKIDEVTYTGIMYEQLKPKQKDQHYKAIPLVNPLRVECFVDNGVFTIFSIMWEDEDTDDPLYYDRKLKKLTRSDLITDNDYSRYIALYDDLAEYQVSVRRVK